jgi:hypothetical protein
MAERSNKLILDTKEMTEGFFEDARLLGVMAPLSDYQFCWHLNNTIGLNFRLNNDLEIALVRKGRNYFFSVYEYNEPTRFLSHYVYNTKFDGEYLLPEFKHLDFLWLMKGDAVADETRQETIITIKRFNGVQLVTEIPIEQVKNKENLVF